MPCTIAVNESRSGSGRRGYQPCCVVERLPPAPVTLAPAFRLRLDGHVAVASGTVHRMRPSADLLTSDVRHELDQLALVHPRNRWPLDADISLARNKHRTDGIQRMRDGLSGPYDWLEGDIRMRGRVPVLQHDGNVVPELTVEEWLAIGRRAERGMKLDIKQVRAVLPSVELALASGIDHRRLLFNLNVESPLESTPIEVLRSVRELAPDVLLNLSPGSVPYTRAQRHRLLALGHELGGPTMYALNDSWVHRHTITHLQSEGARVAIWNDPRQMSAGAARRRVRALRRWGVQGVIDLRGQRRNLAVYVRVHVFVAEGRSLLREWLGRDAQPLEAHPGRNHLPPG